MEINDIDKNDVGILVIATGKERYVKMACNLAISLKLTNPGVPLAVVTDHPSEELHKLYEVIISANPDYGHGFSQKLHMNLYSPFKRTLFIDADCLVIRNISWMLDRFNGKPVSVLGTKKTNGNFLGTTVEKLKEKLSFDFLPTFNGGVYYFEKGDISDQVFEKARKLFYEDYDRLELIKFSGKPGDEPVMSLAMGIFGMQPVEDNEGVGMYTPVGQHSFFRMNAPYGYCEFMKYDKLVSPAIMHFGGGYPEAFHYRREIKKFRLMYYARFSKAMASVTVNTFRNPVYVAKVFLYRVLKRVLKGTPFKWKPAKPMFIFE